MCNHKQVDTIYDLFGHGFASLFHMDHQMNQYEIGEKPMVKRRAYFPIYMCVIEGELLYF